MPNRQNLSERLNKLNNESNYKLNKSKDIKFLK